MTSTAARAREDRTGNHRRTDYLQGCPPLIESHAMHFVKFGRHKINLPGNRFLRFGLGILLICGGLLWFLPVVGFWMLPLGIAVIAIDIPLVDRWWSRTQPKMEDWMQRTFPTFWDKAFAEKQPDTDTKSRNELR